MSEQNTLEKFIDITANNLTTEDFKICGLFFNIDFSGRISKREKATRLFDYIYAHREMLLEIIADKPDNKRKIKANEYVKIKEEVFDIIIKLYALYKIDTSKDKTIKNLFLYALNNVSNINESLLHTLLKYEPNVTLKDEQNKNANGLSVSIYLYDPKGPVTRDIILKVLDLFVRQKGNINDIDNFGISAISYALENYFTHKGDEGLNEILRSILKYKPDVDIQDRDDENALVLAIKAEVPGEILFEIVQLSKNVNVRDLNGETPLSLLLHKHLDPEYNYSVIEILNRQPNVDNIDNRNGMTPVIKVLSMHNYDKNPRLIDIARYIVDASENINYTIQDNFKYSGINALIAALSNTHLPIELLENLFMKKLDMNTVVKKSNTIPLIYATKPHIPVHIFARILNATTDINHKENVTNTTVLMYSLLWEPISTVKTRLILERNPDVNIRNQVGETALNYALKNNAEDIVIKKILDLNAKIDENAIKLAKRFRYRLSKVLYNRIINPKSFKTQVYRVMTLLKEEKYTYQWEQLCADASPDPKNIRLEHLRYIASLENIDETNIKTKAELCKELKELFKSRENKQVPENLKACLNDMTLLGDPIESIPEKLRVVYGERDNKTGAVKLYCFNIIEIVEQIKDGITYNPYTRNELNLNVIQDLYRTLQIQMVENKMVLTGILEKIRTEKIMDDKTRLRLKATNISAMLYYVTPDMLLQLNQAHIQYIFEQMASNRLFKITGEETLNNLFDQMLRSLYIEDAYKSTRIQVIELSVRAKIDMTQLEYE